MNSDNKSIAIKYDGDKLPWDLLPTEAVEQMLRVLAYGKRKYTVCSRCNAKTYPNPRLPPEGDPEEEICPKCGAELVSGAHNWRKGFKWTRLIAAAFRHLSSVLKGEDIDKESGELHSAHLMCCVAFLVTHQILRLGSDDRFKKE